MDTADRSRGAASVGSGEAEAHLGRFLVWLALAAIAFGSTMVWSASVFSSRDLAVCGLSVAAVGPLAIAGRAALGRGSVALALLLVCVPILASETIGVFTLHEVDAVVPIAVIVVLVAVPLVRVGLVPWLFAAVLTWVVSTTILVPAAPPPDVPGWFAHALSVAALLITTALVLLLIRNVQERWRVLMQSIGGAEAQYRTLVEQLPAITFVDEVVDGDPFEVRPMYVSPQVESILGYSSERWFDDAGLWRAILHPDDRERAIALADRIYESREPYTLEYRLIAADGRVVWFEETSVIIPGAGTGPTVWQGVMFDVTARREAEEERNRSLDLLRRADAQRRELLADLVSAQEAERKRLATEIHDDPVQKMAAVGIRLGALLRTLDDADQIRIVNQLQETVELSISRLRALMFDLRPPALDRGGLVPAIRDLIAEMHDTFPRCRIDDELMSEPPDETRTVAYRIAAEALANVQRHSHASDVQITFAERERGVYLRIRDDGIGIAAETLHEARPGHLGLTSIRERAEAAGGWATIEPGPSGGTVVEAWLPVGSDAAADAWPGVGTVGADGAVRSA
jgi:PAS domain S-box-containing protein